MELDWNLLRQRYAPGTMLPSLTGGPAVHILAVDDEALSVQGRLWQDTIRRKDLEAAIALLREGLVPSEPIRFAEAMRRRQLQGPDVDPGCSRRPNLTAVVLKDLGYLEG